MTEKSAQKTGVLVSLVGGGLAVGAFLVLRPFIEPLLWAAVLVIVTWPVFRMLRRMLPGYPGAAALCMTLGLGVLLLAGVIPFVMAAIRQGQAAAALISEQLSGGAPALAGFVEHLPLIGPLLAREFAAVRTEGIEAARWLTDYHPHFLNLAESAARGALRGLFVVGMCLFSSYFLYRDGRALAGQLGRIGRRFGGKRFDHFAATLQSTLRGAVFGTLATALAQGLLAGLAYAAVGAPMPLVLVLMTMFLALIAFGAAMVYIPVAIYLFVQEAPWWHVVGLLVWCVAVVSTIDNIIRTYFISQAARSSVLLVFIGVVGGLLAFGLIGIFLGPAVMAALEAVWREMAEDKEGA